MFNLQAGEVVVMLLLALIFLGPQRPPDLARALAKRLGRRGFVQPAHKVRPLSGMDWMLLGTGFALVVAVLALLAQR